MTELTAFKDATTVQQGGLIGSGAKEAAGKGLLESLSMPDKMAIGSSLVEGVGGYLGKSAEADSLKELADEKYQREKKKLQADVNVDSPLFAMNKPAWQASPANVTGSQKQPVTVATANAPIRPRDEGLLPA
jgi:hypothetical protein